MFINSVRQPVKILIQKNASEEASRYPVIECAAMLSEQLTYLALIQLAINSMRQTRDKEKSCSVSSFKLSSKRLFSQIPPFSDRTMPHLWGKWTTENLDHSTIESICLGGVHRWGN